MPEPFFEPLHCGHRCRGVSARHGVRGTDPATTGSGYPRPGWTRAVPHNKTTEYASASDHDHASGRAMTRASPINRDGVSLLSPLRRIQVSAAWIMIALAGPMRSRRCQRGGLATMSRTRA